MIKFYYMILDMCASRTV